MNGVCTIVIDRDEEGCFIGHAPSLPGRHTQAGSIDHLMERMEEAIALWLEVEEEHVCYRNAGSTSSAMSRMFSSM